MTASGHEAGCGCTRCRGFEPGNVASLRHGALSRLVTDTALEVLEELRVAEAAWLSDVDAVALDSWLFAAVTCARLRQWLNGRAHHDPANAHAHRLLLQWERRLDRAQTRLGFDPLARAGLARDSALARHLAGSDLAGVREAGRRALEARRSDGDGAE